MTTVDVLFRYGAQPDENVMSAYGQLSDVYGIRKLRLEESDRTIRVEYDATRLTDAKVEGLLRAAGFDITEKLALA
jgi:copper chaperone CopZ